MAYVQPRRSTESIAAAALRQGTRFVAIATYAGAVAVAFVLLSPILPSRGSEAVAVAPPSGLQPVLYTAKPGDTVTGIAASQGISLAQLFVLNRDLTPLSDIVGEPLVVGLR